MEEKLLETNLLKMDSEEAQQYLESLSVGRYNERTDKWYSDQLKVYEKWGEYPPVVNARKGIVISSKEFIEK